MVDLIGFSYSSASVVYRSISMLFLSFLSQNTYPEEFLRPEVILSRSYSNKCSISLGLPPIIKLPFYKNVIKYEPFGVRR